MFFFSLVSVINDILDKKIVKYGINTGFGMFATVVIDPKDVSRALFEYSRRTHCK